MNARSSALFRIPMFSLVRAGIVGVVLLAASGWQSANAKPGDMKLGTYEALWCGMSARIIVESRRGQEWIFDGHVLIPETGEFDTLYVRQNHDNSLKFIRTLSGEHSGRRQSTTTHPPKISLGDNGKKRAHFYTRSKGGYGCSGPTTLSIGGY